ncbi:MAG: hypothetical protein Q9166_008034 [cf. Caloplaca sp. 2 TL-2023]
MGIQLPCWPCLQSSENVNQLPPHETPGTPSQSSDSLDDGSASPINSATSDQGLTKEPLDFGKVDGSSSVIEIATATNSSLAYLSRNTAKVAATDSRKNLLVARLAESTPEALPPSPLGRFEGLRVGHQNPTDILHLQAYRRICGLNPGRAMQPSVDRGRPKALGGNQGASELRKPLLWVTKGAQYPLTYPDKAMIHGLFRVARQEDSMAKFTTLDVQSSTSSATGRAI